MGPRMSRHTGLCLVPSSTGVEAHVGGVVVTMVLVSLPAFTTSICLDAVLRRDSPLARYMMALSSSLINGVASSSCMISTSVGIRSCCIAESVFLWVKRLIVWNPSLNLLPLSVMMSPGVRPWWYMGQRLFFMPSHMARILPMSAESLMLWLKLSQ